MMIDVKAIKAPSKYDDGAFLRAFELLWPHQENQKHSLEEAVGVLKGEFGKRSDSVCEELLPTSTLTLRLRRTS